MNKIIRNRNQEKEALKAHPHVKENQAMSNLLKPPSAYSLKLQIAQLIGTSLLATIFLASCAKERPYKEVYKEEEVMPKSLVSTEEDDLGSVVYNPGQGKIETAIGNNVYLYVPSVVDVPRQTSVRPYMMGKERLVKFKFTKDKLLALEIEKEKQFSDVENNSLPILEIPIEHKDYRCKLNAQDECSNEEEENDEIAWKEKKYFLPDFAKAKAIGATMLPVDLMNLFYSCYQEIGSQVSKWSIEDQAINIEVDKTYKSTLGCLRSWSDIENQTFTVTYHYSFVKLNSIAQHDYKTVVYPKSDYDYFGFFKTNHTKLSADNRVTLNSDIDFLNRFSPDKNIITYKLTPNFSKPEMAGILQSTIESVDHINQSFEKAGSPLRIELEQTSELSSGDLRSNSIILVENPMNSGLLGYGPSVTNPATGEILQARTVMYYGNLVTTIKRTYNEMVQKEANARGTQVIIGKTKSPAELGIGGAASGSANNSTNSSAVKSKARTLNSFVLAKQDGLARVNQDFGEYFANLSDLDRFEQDEAKIFFNKLQMKKANEFGSSFSPEFDLKHLTQNLFQETDLLDIYGRHSMFHENYLNSNSLEGTFTMSKLKKAKVLKVWSELSNIEQQEIVDELMPKIWRPVLLHEIGHNLGLRHNFEGSEDSENFYNQTELGNLGISEQVTYSSVMDYTYTDLNALSIMGKYDIAALKFGYARKVIDTQGKEHAVPSTLSELVQKKKIPVKKFGFCSDEAVYLNATCNRFDEGTNYVEIAKHYISAYNKDVSYVNYRSDRYSFSSINNFDYMNRRWRAYFYPMRRFFELYERFDKLATPQQKASDPMFKDLKEATELIGAHLLQIVNQPDAQCKIVDKQTSQTFWLPLKNFRKTHCAAIELSSELQQRYAITSQVGIPFNDLKDLNNPWITIDEIDVRGYWSDKLLALATLFEREIGISTMDEYQENFLSLNVKAGRAQVGTYLEMMIDQMIDGKAQVVVSDGKTQETVDIDLAGTHLVEKQLDRRMNKAVGIKKNKQYFLKYAFDQIRKGIDPNSSARSSKEFAKYTLHTYPVNNSSKVETANGVFFVSQEATKVIEVLMKRQLAKNFEGKDPKVLAQMAINVLQGKDLDASKKILVDQRKAVIDQVYGQVSALFDLLADASLESLEALKTGDVSTVDPALLEEFKKINPSLIGPLVDGAIEVKKDATGELNGKDMAAGFLNQKAVLGPIEDEFKTAEVIHGIQSQGVLVTLALERLAQASHYDWVLSFFPVK